VPALVAASALVVACGMGSQAPSAPSVHGDRESRDDGGTKVLVEAPGPWAPSRGVAVDRFALETALEVVLTGPAGEELPHSTRWTLSGGEVELRFEVRTWFNAAEAEVRCRVVAGDGARESLELGVPTWTRQDAVYLSRGKACVQVSVTRSGRADPRGAAAVTAVLARAH
jgi:hypothetical protein